jgi:hypothetical protein
MANQVGLAWWVEIFTHKPNCTYFFGPFISLDEANAAQPGYVEDLEGENAQGIVVKIHRCRPKELTIFDDAAAVAVTVTPTKPLLASPVGTGKVA